MLPIRYGNRNIFTVEISNDADDITCRFTVIGILMLHNYLYSYTRLFFLAESILVPDPKQEVSSTKGRLSRDGPRLYLP